MSKEFDIAVEAAKEAGALLLSKLDSKLEMKLKTARDFVTDADLESENIILAKIKENFPGHGIISEEAGETGNESDSRWLVDPLDGTNSFVTGLPNFGISIAFEQKGKMQVGIIFLPYLRELLTAQNGKGAFLNGKKISVSNKADIDGTTGSLSLIPKTDSLEGYSRFYDKIFPKMLNMKYFGGVSDFAMVATGRSDFFITRNTNSWDCAAAKVIVEEAGGKMTNFEGQKAPYIHNLVAANPALHTKLLEALRQ